MKRLVLEGFVAANLIVGFSVQSWAQQPVPSWGKMRSRLVCTRHRHVAAPRGARQEEQWRVSHKRGV